MVYTVGFGKRNQPGVSTVRTNTAQEAVELAEALTRSDEDIQFIDMPTDGRVGIDMLRVLAKEEAGQSLAVSRDRPPTSSVDLPGISYGSPITTVALPWLEWARL
jgi:hypothetical protein